MATNLVIGLATILVITGVVAFIFQSRKDVNKPMVRRNLNIIVQCAVMFAYSLSLAFMYTEVRIAEPPMRYFLTLVCFILPVITLYGTFKDKPTVKGWGLINMGVTWLFIGYLYSIAPIYNAGWVMCVGFTALAWVSLSRGDYAG